MKKKHGVNPLTKKRKAAVKPSRPWWRRLWRALWITAVVLLAFSWLQVLLGWFINPPLTPLMAQRFWQQTFEKGREVRFERQYVPIDSISPNLVTAVVYAEDGLFMYHHGFDVKQLKQATLDNKRSRPMRGGSTISNQTAKNAFLPHGRTMLRKAVEAYYTVLIEAVWGKKRIMEVYLNVIEFGDGIYGCEAASQHYFGHSARTLTKHEAAQLAATLPAPLKRNPAHQTPSYKHKVKALEKRFDWGMVDLEMPSEERKGRYKDRENLWQFMIWKAKQK